MTKFAHPHYGKVWPAYAYVQAYFGISSVRSIGAGIVVLHFSRMPKVLLTIRLIIIGVCQCDTFDILTTNFLHMSVIKATPTIVGEAFIFYL